MRFGLFTRRPPPASPATEPGLSPADAGEIVVEPSQIARLLLTIHKHHCLLGVNVIGSDHTYNSAVLEVQPEQRILVLDELTPRDGHALAEQVRRIAVYTRLAGVTVSFEGMITAVAETRGIPYYRVPFPGMIRYQQRREHYRAPVPLEKSVGIHMLTADNRRIAAELRDISLGGMSARLIRGAVAELVVGQVLPRCVITLPNRHRFCSALEVRYAEPGGAQRIPRLGGRFLNVDPRDRNQLEHYVTALDREMQRRQAAAGK